MVDREEEEIGSGSKRRKRSVVSGLLRSCEEMTGPMLSHVCNLSSIPNNTSSDHRQKKKNETFIRSSRTQGRQQTLHRSSNSAKHPLYQNHRNFFIKKERKE